MANEGKLQSKILSFLKAEMKNDNCYFERRNAVGLNYRKGIPDIWFTKNGQHYELELKDPAGSRSTMQVKWAERLVRMKCKYALIDSYEQFLELYEKA